MILAMLSLLACTGQGADPLLVVSLLHRYGSRAPLLQPPVVNASAFEQQWPLGKGELTDLGMQQMYALGQVLNDRYSLWHLVCDAAAF
jgi:hypothetical protein